MPHRPCLRLASRRTQAGVVMIITLLALVLLLIAAVALVRSSRGTTLMAGNLAVKRDLVNQSERGFAAALAALGGSALATDTARSADLLAANYLSYQLTANAQGLPDVLVKDSTFTDLKLTGADIVDDNLGIRIRYVIDRLCKGSGSFSIETCQSLDTGGDTGGSGHLRRPSGETRAAYRITVRVTDVRRNTRAYAQQVVGG
jgi:Tfp pilus assembly protein PilV